MKRPLYLQDVQVVSFAGQTARRPFEKVPPHSNRCCSLRSIFSVVSFLTLKWLWGLCTDDSLDLKLFVNLRFKIPFSSISATLRRR